MPRATGCWALTAVGPAAIAARAACAQPIHKDGFELSLTYGRNQNLVSFEQPFASGPALAGLRDVRIDSRPDIQQNFGVNAAGAVSAFPGLSEFIYNDLSETRLSARLPFGATRSIFTARTRFYEWTSGARLQLPTATWRVRPYVGGGGGTLWGVITGEAENVTSQSETAPDFTYHNEVGVRLFLTRQVGIAPEFRLANTPDDSFYRVLVSAVFRFNRHSFSNGGEPCIPHRSCLPLASSPRLRLWLKQAHRPQRGNSIRSRLPRSRSRRESRCPPTTSRG